MSSDFSGVESTVSGGILRITFDRPARMNAVTAETLDAVTDTFDKHASNPAVGAIVLTGAGRAFCTGADLSPDPEDANPFSAVIIDAANRAVATILDFSRPVIAAVNGPAAGVGVSLALACDLDDRRRVELFPARVHQGGTDAGRWCHRTRRRIDRPCACTEDVPIG